MLAEWGFHAIFTPDFLFIGLLFHFPLPLPPSSLPLTALHMHLGMTENMHNHISRPVAEGENIIPLFYKSAVTSPVAPIQLFLLAERLALAISVCWNYCYENNLPDFLFWPFSLDPPCGAILSITAIFFPLKPHILYLDVLSQFSYPSLTHLPLSTAPLLKFRIMAIYFTFSQLPKFVRGNLMWNKPFFRSRGVAVVSITYPHLSTNVRCARTSLWRQITELYKNLWTRPMVAVFSLPH